MPPSTRSATSSASSRKADNATSSHEQPGMPTEDKHTASQDGADSDSNSVKSHITVDTSGLRKLTYSSDEDGSAANTSAPEPDLSELAKAAADNTPAEAGPSGTNAPEEAPQEEESLFCSVEDDLASLVPDASDDEGPGGPEDMFPDESHEHHSSTESMHDDPADEGLNYPFSDEEYTADHDDAGPSIQTTAPKKPRAKPARSPREYWARVFARESAKRKARSRSNSASGPSKRPKTTAAAAVLSGTGTGTGPADEGSTASLPSMQGVIHATTHKDKFTQLRSAMAEGGDTRRAKTQLRDLREAVKSFGNRRVKAQDDRWLTPNMQTALMQHQMTLTAWMVKRECTPPYGDDPEDDEESPRGGLVADVMGMGKTVMSLACVMGNLPLAEDEAEGYSRATLIVAPNRAVVGQWAREIREHCGEAYRSSAIYRFSDTNPLEEEVVNRYFILTTYHELMHQYPAKDVIAALKEEHSDDVVGYEHAMAAKRGPLFKIDWYRVILDEVHAIKNANGRTSLACSALSAKFRWGLSGTPLANSAEEFFPYVRFLGCQFAETKQQFKQVYINSPRAASNLDALVSLIMYRRTHADSFLNHRIVDLPDSNTLDVLVPLSEQEKTIYRCVEGHYDRILERIKGQKKVDAGGDIPEACLRRIVTHAKMTTLCQAASHPFALEPTIRSRLKRDDIRNMREELAALEDKTPIAENLIDKASMPATGILPSIKALRVIKALPVGYFGGVVDMDFILRLAENESTIRDKSCSVCDKPMKGRANATVNKSKCRHAVCLKCLFDMELGPKKWLELTGAGARDCLNKDCSRPFLPHNISTICDVVQEIKGNKELAKLSQDAIGSTICYHADKNAFFTAGRSESMGVSLAPSSKTTMAMAIILQWLKDAPTDKIIVFTQWVMTAKVLGTMLPTVGLKFVYYYGTMTNDKRTKAIDTFRDDPEVKVMLVGLKCGGQALNLTMANRVIIVDPWWNAVAEDQAYGRVRRIGQTKETHLVRLFSDTPVDRRIRQLQSDKSAEVSRALQDDRHEPVPLDDEALEGLFTGMSTKKAGKQKAT